MSMVEREEKNQRQSHAVRPLNGKQEDEELAMGAGCGGKIKEGDFSVSGQWLGDSASCSECG